MTEYQNELVVHAGHLQPLNTDKRRDRATSKSGNQQSAQLKPTIHNDTSTYFVGTLSKTHPTSSQPGAEHISVCDTDCNVLPPAQHVTKKERCIASQLRPHLSVVELSCDVSKNDAEHQSYSDHRATSLKHVAFQPVLYDQVQGDSFLLLTYRM